MENNRNFFITIALSVLILTLWQVFYMNPRIEAQREAAQIEAQRVEAEKKTTPAAQGEQAVQPAPGAVPAGAGGPTVPAAATPASRDAATAATQRVKLDTPRIY